MSYKTEKEKNDNIKTAQDYLSVLESVILNQPEESVSNDEKKQNKTDNSRASTLYGMKTKLNALSDVVKSKMKYAQILSALSTVIGSVTTVTMLLYLLNKLFNVEEGAIFLIGAVLLGMSFVGSLLCFELYDDNAYHWAKKIIYRTKKYKKHKAQETDYQQKIARLFGQEKFQHGYMAHLQLKLAAYEKTRQDLLKDNHPHDYNIINYLNADLIEFKTTQANTIRCILSGHSEAALDRMCELETLIAKMDNYLYGNEKFNLTHEKFIQSHQQFMHDQGIHTMIEEINAQDKGEKGNEKESNLKHLL